MGRYGYATASALHGVKHMLVRDFMLQVRTVFRSYLLLVSFIYKMSYSWLYHGYQSLLLI
jgi:hypothetical protein